MELLTIQLSEVELLQSMFSDNEISINKTTLGSIQEFVKESRSAPASSALSVIEFTLYVPIKIDANESKTLFVDVKLPHRYPEFLPSFGIKSMGLTKGCSRMMTLDLLNYLESLAGETCMIACVLWLQENAAGYFVNSKEQSYRPLGKDSRSFECTICLTDFEDANELVVISECKHKFCRECLANYISYKTGDVSAIFHHITSVSRQQEDDEDSMICSTKRNRVLIVDDKDVYGIPCPANKCKHVMLRSEVAAFATSTALEHFEKYSRIHKSNLEIIKEERDRLEEINRMLNRARRCPRCFGDDLANYKYNRLRCRKCHTPMCADCFQTHPRAFSCMMWKDELLSAATRGFMRCPWCLAPTEKIDGCNFMTCNCGKNFCNICGSKIDMSMHFSHFLDGPFGNTCLGLAKNKKRNRVLLTSLVGD